MSSSDYVTVQEVIDLWRPLTSAEQTRVETLIPIASAFLRQAAHDLGRDLDAMIEAGDVQEPVVKAVCVDVLRRFINSTTEDTMPMSQSTESALGYSFSGTYQVPGGGWFLMENEKKMLGLKRQRLGVIDIG